LEGLRSENVDIFNGHLEYFTDIGIFYDHLEHFQLISYIFPCTKRNLATLNATEARRQGIDIFSFMCGIHFLLTTCVENDNWIHFVTLGHFFKSVGIVLSVCLASSVCKIIDSTDCVWDGLHIVHIYVAIQNMI
jgi:hypothetical protein